MNKTLNQKIMTVKLKRKDVCELMLACSWAAIDAGGDSSSKWVTLHDILRDQLNEFDLKEANI